MEQATGAQAVYYSWQNLISKDVVQLVHAKGPACWVLGSLRVEPHWACLESRVPGELGTPSMPQGMPSWQRMWRAGPKGPAHGAAGPSGWPSTHHLPAKVAPMLCQLWLHESQIWMAWCLGMLLQPGWHLLRIHCHQNSCPLLLPPPPLGVRLIGGLKGTCHSCFLPDLQQGLSRCSLERSLHLPLGSQTNERDSRRRLQGASDERHVSTKKKRYWLSVAGPCPWNRESLRVTEGMRKGHGFVWRIFFN